MSVLNFNTRRQFLTAGATLGLGAGFISQSQAQAQANEPGSQEFLPSSPPPGPEYKIQHGKIRHSVMGWCFNPMPTETLINACHAMGMTAMEGIDSKFYPRLKELGMKPSLVSSHGFRNGPTDPANHANCIAQLKKGVDLAVEYGSPSVITFTGMRVPGLSSEQMAQNCLDCWGEVLPYAEKHGITFCMEHLNTRDDSHPMKGHPGYFGDDVDFCARLVEQMGSRNFKLLFDLYHVQLMNGDVTRRLRKYMPIIGHIHTAGAPGRGELDTTQEIYFPALMKEILRLGFDGYVAHEFIPNWEDPLAALRHGVAVCDVASGD